MKSKIDIRKQLEAGLSLFLSQGKQITKMPTNGTKRKIAKPKEQVVEIEVEYLPKALQQKYFAE